MLLLAAAFVLILGGWMTAATAVNHTGPQDTAGHLMALLGILLFIAHIALK